MVQLRATERGSVLVLSLTVLVLTVKGLVAKNKPGDTGQKLHWGVTKVCVKRSLAFVEEFWTTGVCGHMKQIHLILHRDSPFPQAIPLFPLES